MELFKSVTEFIVALEKSVLCGAESLVQAEENQLETLLQLLSPEVLTVAQEQELTKRVYEFTTARYGASAGEVNIPKSSKLHVVYDLDDCLIKSAQLAESQPKTLHTTVVERVKGVTGLEITHVDDDLLRATRGYMINVVSLVEAGYHPESDQCKEGLSERKFVFFEKQRRSATDFPPRSLRTTGKDVKEVVPQDGLTKALLLDDAVAYLKAQPTRGIWIKRFANEPGAIPDKNGSDRELLNVLPMLVRALLISNSKNHDEKLPEMLSEAQSDQYWKDLMVQILRTHARVNADFDVTASENATWQTVVAVLDDYAKQQGIFSPSGSDVEGWRAKLESRWHSIVKKEKKVLLKSLASFVQKRKKAQAAQNS